MGYPIVMNFKNQRILIVGGGKVAYRKAKKLRDYSVNLSVYSPEFISDFEGLTIKKIVGKLTVNAFDLLESYDFIFAATDDEGLNKKILEYCQDKRILVSSATDQLSDFIVPASFKIGDLLISISTAGKAPFLSRQIKEDLKSKYTEEYLDLIFKVRECLKKTNNKDELYQLLTLPEEELRDYYEKNYCRG